MSLRIVTHCYARELPQYAAFLRHQMQALDRLADSDYHLPVVLSVCCTAFDVPTWKAVHEWMKSPGQKAFTLNIVCLPEGELWRRSIGRNKIALSCTEDFVWFADVDYLPTMEFIRGIHEEFPSQAAMIYPNEIWIQKTHELGDQLASGERPHILWKLDFERKHYSRAVGGVQIVRGELARKIGYLNNNEKWQRPVAEPFKSFRDDLAFRRECRKHGQVVGVDLPELYRLRHTKTTYQGST